MVAELSWVHFWPCICLVLEGANAARVVLLASGSGTLAQAIIDAEELDIEIVALISDNPDAQALTRAKQATSRPLSYL